MVYRAIYEDGSAWTKSMRCLHLWGKTICIIQRQDMPHKMIWAVFDGKSASMMLMEQQFVSDLAVSGVTEIPVQAEQY